MLLCEEDASGMEDHMETLDLSDAAPSPTNSRRSLSPGIRSTPPPLSVSSIASPSQLSGSNLTSSAFMPVGSSRRQ